MKGYSLALTDSNIRLWDYINIDIHKPFGQCPVGGSERRCKNDESGKMVDLKKIWRIPGTVLRPSPPLDIPLGAPTEYVSQEESRVYFFVRGEPKSVAKQDSHGRISLPDPPLFTGKTRQEIPRNSIWKPYQETTHNKRCLINKVILNSWAKSCIHLPGCFISQHVL